MPWSGTQVGIPSFVRIKQETLGRLGIYVRRHGHERLVVFLSAGLPQSVREPMVQGFSAEHVAPLQMREITEGSFESAVDVLSELPSDSRALMGVGGGKALDVAKYVATLAGLPFYAVPTSLSNDGFSSPQSSLTLRGKRKSMPAALPFGVVVDTVVCSQAPDLLWWSGIGDLVAKFTAVHDWKLAFHACGEPVDDLAALLSHASVYQFMAHPVKDTEGIQLLATALLLNGISMAICGSSRPASGAEHLISHALDQSSDHPRLHGLQVGIATYLISRLQQDNTDRIVELFDRTSFWQAVQRDPFSRKAWREAIHHAPRIKPDRYTVLSQDGAVARLLELLEHDQRLQDCFIL
jgi:glycerol-1-phosphate dehydrogenase [NAD(P)+]